MKRRCIRITNASLFRNVASHDSTVISRQSIHLHQEVKTQPGHGLGSEGRTCLPYHDVGSSTEEYPGIIRSPLVPPISSGPIRECLVETLGAILVIVRWSPP